MKKLLSLLLVLSLSVSLLGGSVLAVAGNNAPFELVAALNDESKTVTLSLKTTGQLSFGNMDVQLNLDSISGNGFSLTTIVAGNDYAEFNAAPPVSNV